MGEHRNRPVRSSSQRSRLLPAAFAGAVVVVVALAFAVAGVDGVEVLATLLFAPVVIAALLGGRKLGYTAAAGATLGYLALRSGDIADSGAVAVGALVGARAVCYGLVAYATPNFRHRVADLPGAGSMAEALEHGAPHHQGAPEAVPALLGAPADGGLGYEPDPGPPGPGALDWPDAPAGVGEDDQAAFVTAWDDPLPAEDPWGPQADAGWVTDEPVWDETGPVVQPEAPGPWAFEPPAPNGWESPVPEPVAAEPVAAEPVLDEQVWAPPPPPRPPDPAGAGWAPPANGQQPSARGRYMGPPAPTVPTGWVDDATIPLGDETIPLGYTGELFLPRDLQEQPGPGVAGPSLGNGRNHAGQTRRSGNGWAGPTGTPAQVGGRGAPRLRPGVPPSRARAPGGGGMGPPAGSASAAAAQGGVDPETRLWNARFFRDRLTTARDDAARTGSPFSVVMIQVSDEPFQALPYRRQVALLRELGNQFLRAGMIDHLVHLPDGAQHWFAVVLPDTDRAGAHLLERRLRSAIASYLRSRGLHLSEVQSASLTSPDDDEVMSNIWASLLGSTSVG